ncbi:hypothetical protein Cantr_06828 [Candida viswanathii]|uniref:Serine protease n=1 Tax=Candida viswanathii TaxID=5486 RepID=A0A367XVS5_9ASCO|nr:hypothetical protein Cantr_06828 [Candida viswanathii]
MGVTWEYNPVSIRYQNKHHIYASSGIHLLVKDSTTHNLLEDCVLTINHVPNVSAFQILISENTQQQSDGAGYDVVWNLGRIREIKQVPFENMPGFDLFPFDQYPSAPKHHVEVLKLTSYDLNRSGKKVGVCRELHVGEEIKVRGYPFNLTNSLIFRDYVTKGHVVGMYSGLYLTDIRYVENLNGGIVLSLGDGFAGLVFGNLRKRNGDGDLIAILGVSRIVELLGIAGPSGAMEALISVTSTPPPTPISPTPTTSSTTLTTSITPQSSSILPLLITDAKGNTSWGTSIHYAPSILVTNNHVIQPYFNHGTCQIYTSPTTSFHLRSTDTVLVPITSLDLAFIFINDPRNKTVLDGVPTIKGISKSYSPGDAVYALNTSSPLCTHGEVNCVYDMALQNGLSRRINSLVIASASVFNGSSGGGLFLLGSDLLVGLICSNANVRVPKVHSDEFTLEKNTAFAFVIPLDIIEYVYYAMICAGQDESQLNSDLGKLWNLESFHNDVLLHSTKL